MVCQLGQRCVMVVVLLLALLSWVSVWAEEKIIFDRHAVYWNSSNPKFWHGEYRVAVNINDYLDIYCPYYEGLPSHGRMERYILFMVNHEGYTSCQHRMRGFKRWECNRPSGPTGPCASRRSSSSSLPSPWALSSGLDTSTTTSVGYQPGSVCFCEEGHRKGQIYFLCAADPDDGPLRGHTGLWLYGLPQGRRTIGLPTHQQAPFVSSPKPRGASMSKAEGVCQTSRLSCLGVCLCVPLSSDVLSFLSFSVSDGSGYDSPEPFLTDGGPCRRPGSVALLAFSPGCDHSPSPPGAPTQGRWAGLAVPLNPPPLREALCLRPPLPPLPPPPLYDHQPPPLPAPSMAQPRTPSPGLAERVGAPAVWEAALHP
ncbi:hypothetical protein F7725_008358 [Dissostichus mawsoni]|uniref:Ephrin RBD domain-containing protein n=1 Tax=Dissostichus mawsoni TaxID=36200 RepID=A0A7J5Y6Z3_DISMA|nr:hypothetical protein F7725_008358 [Dissostichus mawsoni]